MATQKKAINLELEQDYRKTTLIICCNDNLYAHLQPLIRLAENFRRKWGKINHRQTEEYFNMLLFHIHTHDFSTKNPQMVDFPKITRNNIVNLNTNIAV